MGGKSGGSQVIGYRYHEKLVVALGNPIEDVLAINFDNRGPQYGERTVIEHDGKVVGVNIGIYQPNLYGKEEGGVHGNIRFYFGSNDQMPDLEYAAHMISNGKHPVAYQGFMSYAVFSGGKVWYTLKNLKKDMGHYVNSKSFYFGNSGYVKEMSYLVKRINVRHDGREQWYKEKAEINPSYFSGSIDSAYLYNVQDGFSSLSQLAPYAVIDFDDTAWNLAQGPFGYVSGSGLPQANTFVSPSRGRAIMIREYFNITNPLAVGNLIVKMRHDDGGVLFWNGEQIALSIDDYYNSTATIGTDKFRAGRNILFAAAVDSVPAGSPSGIYLNLSYEAETNSATESDINPVHFIREILTDDRAMSIPESEINEENFRHAADIIYSEGLGISLQLEDKNCKEALDEVCGHIEAGVRVNRQTGLYEVVLFRDDWFDLDYVQHFTRSHINTLQIESSGGGADDINTLNVKYSDREKNQDISFPVYNNGAKHNAGRENPEDINLMYFKNSHNANMVAAWKLKQMTTPTWSGSFTTSSYDARKLNRYDVIKISPGVHGISELPVRVMKIGLGNGSGSNEVSIDFVEVIPFSDEQYNPVIIEPPIVIDTLPTQADFIVHEVTYLEAVQQYGQREVDLQLQDNPNLGYLAVSAVRPKPQAMRAALHTDAGGGYSEKQAVFFCPSLTLDQDIGYTDTLFAVKEPVDMSNALPGLLIRIGDELMVFVEYDEETSLLRVKRGVSPTVPKPHLKDAVFYFVDDFTYADPTQYITGEIVDAKVQTVMASSVQDINTADIKSLEIVGLMNRPYPPANVKINDEYWPAEIETDLILTWVDRNRVQQTGGEPLGWFDGGVAIESGTSTYLVLTEYDEDQVVLATNNVNVTGSNSYLFPISSVQASARNIEIMLKTIRDGYECAVPFIHSVELSQFFSAPYDLTVEFKND
jgi:hypothetical protein